MRRSVSSTLKMDKQPESSRCSTCSSASHIFPCGLFIDGQYWGPNFTPENLRSAKAMKPRADDVFICTYAKSGTTWIQHIVNQLLGKNEYDAAIDSEENNNQKAEGLNEKKAMFYSSPMIERLGATQADAIPSPRVLKSHLNFFDIPKNGGSKYIFACRNPKDCLTSYYHHHKMFTMYEWENGEFDVFFDLFMKGEIGCGDYFDHLESWLEGTLKGDEKILFFKYEDMVADLSSAVVEIGLFLGGKAADIVRNEKQLANVVEASTFTSMKKNQHRWVPKTFAHMGGHNFIRKGESRDWKNYFSREQSDRMDERFRKRCNGTVASQWWSAEMEWNEHQTTE